MVELFLACIAAGLAILSFFVAKKFEALAAAIIALAAIHILAFI